MNEQTLIKHTLISCSQIGNRLFRNNTGTGWVGKNKRLPGNRLIIDNPRPLTAGLCTGSSDLIGWTLLTIEPHHVGLTLPIFTGVELKHGKTRTTKAQQTFIDQITNNNGVGLITRSTDDYLQGIEEWKNNLPSTPAPTKK